MKDRDFLIWVHERLEYVHGDHPLVDFMHKLRAVISSMNPEHETPIRAQFNSLEELKEELRVK